jgi:hypothetical protein
MSLAVVGMALAVLLLAGCSSPALGLPRGTASPVAYTVAYAAASLRADLQAAGLTVTQTKDAINQGFSIPGQRWQANGENVYVYEYADPAGAATDAAGVSPDGTTITRADHGQSVMRSVDWIATPHFYRRGRLIVIYAGDSSSLIITLSGVLGAPFAGGQLLTPVGATPAHAP